MNEVKESSQKHVALWATVILEGLMIIAVALYNIYEIRRNSDLVQRKIEGLSQFSARQGEKVDHMITALEIYVGRKFSTNAPAGTNALTTEQKMEKALQFLEGMKRKTPQPAEGTAPK